MAPQTEKWRTLGAVQSASNANNWYRVELNLRTPQIGDQWNLTCSCVQWCQDQRRAGQDIEQKRLTPRSCKHTDPFAGLLAKQHLPHAQRPGRAFDFAAEEITALSPLLRPIRGGTWFLQEREAPVIGTKRGRPVDEMYKWYLLGVRAGDTIASGMVAFNANQPLGRDATARQFAAWAGYAIAREFAQRAGITPGDPPAYFRYEGGKNKKQFFGLGNLAAAAQQTDLGDGLRPTDRAEQLLKLMLGAQYADLDRHSYLDVSSARPKAALDYLHSLQPYNVRDLPRTCNELVYRVRIDPTRMTGHGHDRRVRLFINREYVCDLCIVRGYAGYEATVPVADAFLSTFLGLISDELKILQVVGSGNVFGRFSDQQDTAGPAPIWVARAA